MDNTNIDNFISDRIFRMKLKNVRESKGLSQAKLSEISGLSITCISNIESDTCSTSPTLRSLIKYANALGIEFYIQAQSKEIDK